MPYFPTATNSPKAILANAGSVTWLLGGPVQGSDPNAVPTIVGETPQNAATMPCSPAFNQGRSVNTFCIQAYFTGGTATMVLQGSMTNRDADYYALAAVNGMYQTNLPFVRVLISMSSAASIALAIIF